MGFRVSHEKARGCGYRKVGGLYMVTAGEGRRCGRFPMPLTVCPTCHGGIKQTRSFQWINPRELFKDQPCSNVGNLLGSCGICPLTAELPERAGLLWIGEQFYRTPEDFRHEAQEMGISRRVSAMPKTFKIGEDWVMLAHRKAIWEECACVQSDKGSLVGIGDPGCEACEGGGKSWTAGVFYMFRPSAVEKIVEGRLSQDEENALERRGIETVQVVEV